MSAWLVASGYASNWASQMVQVVKNPHASADDIWEEGSIPGLERFPREGNGNPLQYSCLKKSMDNGTWWATVHGVAKSQTWLKQLSIHAVSCSRLTNSSFWFIIIFSFFNFTILYWFCHISTWTHHRYTVFPILSPPPSSLPIPSLWVVPVHQPQASSIVHRSWTGNSFHIWYYTCFNAILPNHPTLSQRGGQLVSKIDTEAETNLDHLWDSCLISLFQIWI